VAFVKMLLKTACKPNVFTWGEQLWPWWRGELTLREYIQVVSKEGYPITTPTALPCRHVLWIQYIRSFKSNWREALSRWNTTENNLSTRTHKTKLHLNTFNFNSNKSAWFSPQPTPQLPILFKKTLWGSEKKIVLCTSKFYSHDLQSQ